MSATRSGAASSTHQLFFAAQDHYYNVCRTTFIYMTTHLYTQVYYSDKFKV